MRIREITANETMSGPNVDKIAAKFAHQHHDYDED
jgi:hypothetical protein